MTRRASAKGAFNFISWLCGALFLCALAATPSGAGDTIVWGTDGDYPPFVTDSGTGTPAGLDRDVAEAVCAQVKRPCRFVVAGWPDLFPGLRRHDYDVVYSGLTRATVATQGLTPSRIYFTANPRFATLQENQNPIAIGNGDAILGVLAGTPYDAYLQDRLNDRDRLRRFPDEEELYFSLLNGGIDAIFADGLSLYQDLILHPTELPVELRGDPVEDAAFFDSDIVFAFASEGPLSSEINRAIATLATNGTLARIVERYLPGYAIGGAD